MTLPVKALCDIEVKECVSCSDKILILDSDTDEARLACKDEIKWDKWDPWDPGAAATVSVGTTCTLAPGTSACVSNSGSSSAAVFNFGIPKWEKWDQGNPWTSATVSVWSTTTLDAGCCASVTNTGTTSAAVFNFWIPKGAKWDPGCSWNDWASICAAAFSGDDIVFTKDNSCTVTLSWAKTCLKWDQWEPGNDGCPGQDGNGITCVTTSKSWKTTTVTMCYDTGDPTIFCVQDGADGAWSWDMSASTYDPTNKMADAFDYCNFYNTPTIPTDNCQLANWCGFTTCTWTVVAADLAPYALAANLCAVSTSWKYCDLSWTPTIPTDNCQLANWCGYITSSALSGYAQTCDIPTNNCQLSNGCWYTTCTWTLVPWDLATYAKCSDIPTNNNQLTNWCGYTTCTGTLSADNAGTCWQVLTKTDSWACWCDPTWWWSSLEPYTQDEYDALPSSKLTDWVWRLIYE